MFFIVCKFHIRKIQISFELWLTTHMPKYLAGNVLRSVFHFEYITEIDGLRNGSFVITQV